VGIFRGRRFSVRKFTAQAVNYSEMGDRRWKMVGQAATMGGRNFVVKIDEGARGFQLGGTTRTRNEHEKD
jgi:hypothetical protein